ncbi:MAG: rhodanese-like domain-containing protein [Usitatibacteraceae bacterium]
MNAPISELEEILALAAERGRARALPYAGAVTPREAHRLALAHGAKIIDVRSSVENAYIGRIPQSALIVWKEWPSGEQNKNFVAELQAVCSSEDIVLFLCRSGVRSHSTATVAAEVGFKNAFNILEGFEGDLDANSQRGNLGGWRKAGLPWVQD